MMKEKQYGGHYLLVGSPMQGGAPGADGLVTRTEDSGGREATSQDEVSITAEDYLEQISGQRGHSI